MPHHNQCYDFDRDSNPSIDDNQAEIQSTGLVERVLLWVLALWNSHMYTIISFILLVMAFVFLLFFLPKPGNYYDYERVCPRLSVFNADFCEDFMERYGQSLRSSTVPNPAPIIVYNRETGEARFDYLEIYQALQSIPSVCRAFIARIPRHSEQCECRLLTPNTLRCVVPLYVPAGNQVTVAVDQEIRFLKTGKVIVFDASHVNRMINKQKRRDAWCLFVDIERPPGSKPAVAGPDDKCCEGLIAQFVPR